VSKKTKNIYGYCIFKKRKNTPFLYPFFVQQTKSQNLLAHSDKMPHLASLWKILLYQYYYFYKNINKNISIFLNKNPKK